MKTITQIELNPINAYYSPKMATGFQPEQIQELGPKLAKYQTLIKDNLNDLDALRKLNQAWISIHELPEIDVTQINKVASDLRNQFQDVVVIGIGGSDFGPRALFDIFLGSDDYNNLYAEHRGYDGKPAPRIHFFQSFDARKCRNFLRRTELDLTQTVFIVISKSGKTLETKRNFEFFRKTLKETLAHKGKEKDLNQHFVLVTDESFDQEGKPKSVLLQEFWDSQSNQCTARSLFPVPDGVGGRFSVFSPVGLLPAAVLGINIEELMAGIQEAFDTTQIDTSNSDNLPVQLACVQYLAMQSNRTIHYFYAFGEVFKNLTKWYEQLTEESLGKRLTNSQNQTRAINFITKPTVGTIDNHSFVQNLLGGDPSNKFVIFLNAEDYARDTDISGDDGLHFDDNLIATFEGTRMAVCEEGIPNVTLTLPKIGEREIAQLMYFLEVSIAYLGEALLELEGNTFLQPDVEKYKIKTMEALKKKG